MGSEGVRPFGPTELVTMMKCRLNGGGSVSQARELWLPLPLCPTHGYCSNPFSAPRRRWWVRMSYISSFSPDLQLICQPWEDKHVFYTLDLLLSEGQPSLSCLTESCLWHSACFVWIEPCLWFVGGDHFCESAKIWPLSQKQPQVTAKDHVEIWTSWLNCSFFEWTRYVLCSDFVLCVPISIIIWDSDKWLAYSWGRRCVPRLCLTKVTRRPGACVVLSSPTPCWGEDWWSPGSRTPHSASVLLYCLPTSCPSLTFLELVCPKPVSDKLYSILSIIFVLSKYGQSPSVHKRRCFVALQSI